VHQLRQKKDMQAEHSSPAKAELLPYRHYCRILALYRLSSAFSADGGPRNKSKRIPASPYSDSSNDSALRFHVPFVAEKGAQRLLMKPFG
jgi:hypothetical protein